MCGYCIETGAVLPFIKSKLRHEGNFQANYFQETDDLKGDITTTKGLNNSQGVIDIVFCRLYDQYITHAFDISLFDLVSISFSSDVIQSFFARRKEGEGLWKELGNEYLYKDEKCWNNFIRDKENISNNSLAMLNAYDDWWLLDSNRVKKDHSRFDSVFPILSFSLSFVAKHCSESAVIKKIALESPYDVPGFWGNDLWLQRRAMIACAKQHGLGFILDNLSKLRFELIYYVLLKTDTNPIELNKLKKVILSEDEHPMRGMMESEPVIALIDHLIHKKTYM
jgi:hypothetical protein